MLFRSFNVDLSATSPLGQIYASQGSLGVVQALNKLFLHGTMSATTAQTIAGEMKTVPGATPEEKLRLGIYLVITSTQYKILH